MNQAWQAYEQVANWATDHHMSSRARMRQTVRWGMHLVLLLILAAWAAVFARGQDIELRRPMTVTVTRAIHIPVKSKLFTYSVPCGSGEGK